MKKILKRKKWEIQIFFFFLVIRHLVELKKKGKKTAPCFYYSNFLKLRGRSSQIFASCKVNELIFTQKRKK